MNLSNSRRSELSGIPFLNTLLDWLISRINEVWAAEHDPESGAHTDITADSLTLSDLEDGDADGNIAGHLVPQTTDTYTLGTQKTTLPGTPYLAWKELYLTDRFDWIGTATSAAGNAIPSWSTTMSGDDLTTRAPVATTQTWTFTSSNGTTLLRLGDSVAFGNTAVFSGTLITNLNVTRLASTSGVWNGGPLTESGKVTPPQITANQNNYSPTGLSTARVLRLSADASRNITGLTAPLDSGRCILLQNVGAQDICAGSQRYREQHGRQLLCLSGTGQSYAEHVGQRRNSIRRNDATLANPGSVIVTVPSRGVEATRLTTRTSPPMFLRI